VCTRQRHARARRGNGCRAKAPFEAPSKLGTSQGKPFDSRFSGRALRPSGQAGATFKAKTHPKRQKQIPRRWLLAMTPNTRRKAPGPATEKQVAAPWATSAFGAGTGRKGEGVPGLPAFVGGGAAVCSMDTVRSGLCCRTQRRSKTRGRSKTSQQDELRMQGERRSRRKNELCSKTNEVVAKRSQQEFVARRAVQQDFVAK
jgi:hypothetical protein